MWSHLIGAIVVFFLMFYTVLFFKSHKEIITNFDFSKLNHEISDITQPIFPKIQSIAYSMYNSTLDYVHTVDNKIKLYSEYITKNELCISCMKEIITIISTLRNSISELTEFSGSDLVNFLTFKEKKWLQIFRETEKHIGTEEVAKWPIFIQLSGAILCLSCSWIFHLFNAQSKFVNDILNRLDFGGISLLIVGSCYPPNYYLFYCSFGKGV